MRDDLGWVVGTGAAALVAAVGCEGNGLPFSQLASSIDQADCHAAVLCGDFPDEATCLASRQDARTTTTRSPRTSPPAGSSTTARRRGLASTRWARSPIAPGAVRRPSSSIRAATRPTARAASAAPATPRPPPARWRRRPGPAP